MPIPIANIDSSWISSLSDATVRTDMTAAAADGVLSYSEIVGLLTDVQNQGTVTVAEFGDLQAITAHLNAGIATSDYLASVLTQLVNGSPANANWNGGSATATALGNLAVGSTATQLSQLIGKWFLGTDLPDPTTSGGTALNYKTFTLPLYGSSNAPTPSDVAQGALGDCVVCAAMMEIANAEPGALQSNIVSVGNGVYGVRFYINGVEAWVTVNSQLPVSGSNALVYMNANNGNNPPLWADIEEKAYAELSATGLIGHPAVNSFENIDSNNAVTVAAAMTNADMANYKSSDANWSLDKQAIVAAVTGGDVVLFSSSLDTTDNAGKKLFVSDHEFAIVGYDAATGKFIARNPWGDKGAWQSWIAQFEVSMDDLAAATATVCVANTVSTPVHIVTAQGQCFSSHGWYFDDVTRSSTFAEFIGLGATVAISPLFTVIDATGAPITQYLLQNAGQGSIQLNGAVNLATPDQQALGDILVSASDFTKLTYAAPATAGYTDLIVSAFDGSYWSGPTDVALNVTTDVCSTINPTFNCVVAPSGTIAIGGLFNLVGGGIPTYYQFNPKNGGTVNTNGATSWGSNGNVVINAADLGNLTYTAPSTPGVATLDVWAYIGGTWSQMQYVQLLVGESAAQAIQDYDNGKLTTASAIADSAANIYANLDGLQAMMSAGTLQAVTPTNSSAVTQTLTPVQHANDRGVLSIMAANPNVLVISTPRRDFGGAGTSDVLLQNAATGEDYNWIMNGTTIGAASGCITTNAGTAWHIAATGDFDGGGKADILLQNNATGQAYVWLMNGTAVLSGSGAIGTNAGTDWKLVGTGDFNGDGKADILLQSASTGQDYIWLMNGTAIQPGSGAIGLNPGPDWKVAGIGDLNGDGKSDIVLQNATTGQVYIWCMSGTTIGSGSGAVGTNAGTDWNVVGTGDFDGDWNSDILLRNSTTGQLYVWCMSGTKINSNSGAIGLNPGTGWQVASIGDYNGDGKSDILLQNTATNELYAWMMSGASILSSSGGIGTNPGASWQVFAGTGG